VFLSIIMPRKLVSISFIVIIATALLLTTITAVSLWATTQPALAKLSSSTGNDQNPEDKVLVATTPIDEISSRLTLVGLEEEEDYDNNDAAADDIDDSLDEASVTKYKDEVDQVDEGEQQCRKGDVLEGVYDPERLKVLSSCEEAIGIVEDYDRAHDDDIKLFLDVEEGYKRLLNDENYEKTNGELVVEIIPDDQGSSSVQIPDEGDRVRVVGAWVTDEGAGGWNEIHPAWKVEVLR